MPRLFTLSPLLAAFALATASALAADAVATAKAPPDLTRTAPNVVVVLLDDVGFGAAGTFGGPTPTPTLDRLARQGLSYNRFHTAAICSPTRASLLTGRNPHAVNVGSVMNSASPQPGRNGFMPKSAATVAEILRQNGYATSAWGKWHLTPQSEETPVGPFDRWPTGMGFEKFYGFLDGETHQFEPTLFDGTTPVARPKASSESGYHFTEDMTNRAIAWARQHKALAPQQPLFMYYAPGATHAPLHAPKAWIDRFRGQFDQGWDKVREEILARQKKLGVVPANTQLTPRPPQLPAWDSLSPERQRIAATLMEVYAGFLAHTDAEIGRLAKAFEDMGEFDNTLFIYIVGDNGASGEGGVYGTLNFMGSIQGFSLTPQQALALRDQIGGPETYPHYPAGWAWAMDTPFQWTKQVASHLGGTRNPMVVTWPARIRDRGGLRSQFSFVSDIMPTILDAAGIPAPAVVNGVAQQPVDGVSLFYSFDDARAPTRHDTQYFEVFGNRGIYHQGWLAGAFHGRPPWMLIGNTGNRSFDEDPWELYDLETDFSQAKDLARDQPEKLRQMKELFLAEARRNQVLPMVDETSGRRANPYGQRTRFEFHAGAEGVSENVAPRTQSRSHRISADIVIPKGGAQGVLAALGGSDGGWSLYLDKEGRAAYTYNLFALERFTVKSPKALPPGPATVVVDFLYDGGGYGKGATVRLSINGEAVGEMRLARTAPAVFSIGENFDIGTDSGSPVADYPTGYRFTGALGKVVLELK